MPPSSSWPLLCVSEQQEVRGNSSRQRQRKLLLKLPLLHDGCFLWFLYRSRWTVCARLIHVVFWEYDTAIDCKLSNFWKSRDSDNKQSLCVVSCKCQTCACPNKTPTIDYKNTENQKPFLWTQCPSVYAHRTFDPEVACELFDLGRTEKGLKRWPLHHKWQFPFTHTSVSKLRRESYCTLCDIIYELFDY